MQTFTDQIGRKIQLERPAERIISLVPSQTELLYDLGLREEVIGITKFCVHPEAWFRSKTRVGGTKQYHFNRIAGLKPDLIIANKEENEQTQIEQLMRQYPVWLSDIYTLEDAFQMMLQVGKLVNREVSATTLVQKTRIALNALPKAKGKRVAYLIWRKPYMAAANGTFIHEMLQICGFQNVFEAQCRYPTVTLEQLAVSGVEYLFLSSEPYPFKAQHIAELQTLLPKIDIQLVDGEAFSWYGSRILKSIPYLKALSTKIHS